MPEYEFTLIIDGDLTGEDTVDALFNAGCDDATFGGTGNIGTGDFARAASSLADAIVTAMTAVESVPGLRVRRVEPDDLVTIPEIAERLGRTAESVRLLANGERGGGSFPAPISHLITKHRMWRWSDVAAWAGQLEPEGVRDARVIAAMNAMLELRHVQQTDPVLLKDLQARLSKVA